jgi:hypothetical protein
MITSLQLCNTSCPTMTEALYGLMCPRGLVSPKFEREDEPTQEIEMLLNEVPD